MWWKDPTDLRSQRVWAVKDGERVLLYVFNDGMQATSIAGLKRGYERHLKEAKELQQAGGQLLWPAGYMAMCDGIYAYLTEYRRDTGRCPSSAMWAQAWKGTVDSGGRVLTACFACSRCRLRRKVNVLDLLEVLSLQKKKKDTCDVLENAQCRVPNDCVWMLDRQVIGLARHFLMYSSGRVKEEKLSSDEREVEEGNEMEGIHVGFSQEAKQFYKAQGKHLQMPCYKGESSEVDLFAWKRGIEKYFETYGIVVEREKVTMAADTLEGEAAKWWNGLWMSNRDGGIRMWNALLERLRERFLPPEGEMRIVGRWRQLQQKGSVASYADYVFWLKALCDMDLQAEFKLAFFGLQPEL